MDQPVKTKQLTTIKIQRKEQHLTLEREKFLKKINLKTNHRKKSKFTKSIQKISHKKGTEVKANPPQTSLRSREKPTPTVQLKMTLPRCSKSTPNEKVLN